MRVSFSCHFQLRKLSVAGLRGASPPAASYKAFLTNWKAVRARRMQLAAIGFIQCVASWLKLLSTSLQWKTSKKSFRFEISIDCQQKKEEEALSLSLSRT